jgi:hypothetical protein
MKPTVVAADAGLMGIQWGIRPVRKYVESVRQSGTDDMRRASVVEVARLMTMDDDEQREEEIYRARRQRSAASAATPKTFVMCIVVSCGIRDRKRWRTELYFGGSESFDDHHWATALRAAPKIVWTIGDRRVLLVAPTASEVQNVQCGGDPMILTPSTKGSFIAGVGLWLLFWASLFKADEIAEVLHLQQWLNSARCFHWINRHKSTSLLTSELVNYGTHGISDPLGVTFALGGTLVNIIMIYLFLPSRERLRRTTL